MGKGWIFDDDERSANYIRSIDIFICICTYIQHHLIRNIFDDMVLYKPADTVGLQCSVTGDGFMFSVRCNTNTPVTFSCDIDGTSVNCKGLHY